MPLIYGQALSYSPLLYRSRSAWAELYHTLVGDVVQPRSADVETPDRLDLYEQRLHDAFWFASERINAAHLDALIVLVADEARTFDDTNTPQIHVFGGDEIWGDPALPELDESSSPRRFRCHAGLAAQLGEELARAGFDVSETIGAYRPLGDPARGVVPALVEPLTRFDLSTPIVPIHINCHVTPCLSNQRLAGFGAALAQALSRMPLRVGILASGGLSGQPGDAMAGWIDDVLDRWVMARLRFGRSADLDRLFDVRSQSLQGSTNEIRLWATLGAACELGRLTACTDDYLPIHHAAAGIGFMHWSR